MLAAPYMFIASLSHSLDSLRLLFDVRDAQFAAANNNNITAALLAQYA